MLLIRIKNSFGAPFQFTKFIFTKGNYIGVKPRVATISRFYKAFGLSNSIRSYPAQHCNLSPFCHIAFFNSILYDVTSDSLYSHDFLYVSAESSPEILAKQSQNGTRFNHSSDTAFSHGVGNTTDRFPGLCPAGTFILKWLIHWAWESTYGTEIFFTYFTVTWKKSTDLCIHYRISFHSQHRRSFVGSEMTRSAQSLGGKLTWGDDPGVLLRPCLARLRPFPSSTQLLR